MDGGKPSFSERMVDKEKRYHFAALRFFEDENISDRIYWYLCPFLLREGERVLAPVGYRDGLQLACVERIYSASAEQAPYDMRFIKRVAAKYGARKLPLGGGFCTEFGGVRYDSKRYTRFGAFLYSDNLRELSRSDARILKEYGVTAVVDMRDSGGEIAGIPVLRFSDASDALNFAAKEKGCVLFLGSAGGAVCAYLFRLAGCSREETVKRCASGGSYFCTENIPPDTLRALRAKLI